MAVEIPGGKLETVALKEALPKIEFPIALDARSQPGALVAGARKIGLIVNGAAIASGEPNGLELGSGAAGSTIAGLQIEHFAEDGVLLAGEHEQVADWCSRQTRRGSRYRHPTILVGTGEGLPGDIFYADGKNGIVAYLEGLKKTHKTAAELELGIDVFGADVLLAKQSSSTRIVGDDIGIHGPASPKRPTNSAKTASAPSTSTALCRLG